MHIRHTLNRVIGSTEIVPTPLLPRRLTLDALPLRPVVRRWAEATVRELRPHVRPLPRTGRRRLLALFIDGLASRTLARAARDGTMPFLGRLRDSPAMQEARTFSGLPSTTTAYQAGLFYGLHHPDVPAFNWFDRNERKPMLMQKPQDAAGVEARLREQTGGHGLFRDGSSYLSVLRGGAADHLNTAGVAAIVQREELPGLEPDLLFGQALIHMQSALSVAARLALETGPFLWDMRRFVREKGNRHEGPFLLNKLLLGMLLKEVAQGQAILDLVRGVPRVFFNFHDYDEVSHRRGPVNAEAQVLRGIDHSVEAMFAIAAACDDPPDVYVFSDHGQIPSFPFEREFGCTFPDWVRGAGDGVGPPELPRRVIEAVGVEPGPYTFEPDLVPMDSGNYAHVYFERGEPLDARAIVQRHARSLARILACPGVGLSIMRHDGGAIAFGPNGQRVDPAEPGTIPRGVSPEGIAAAMNEMVRSPAAGDVLCYGAWRHDGCYALSWEWSSHGGPSYAETENFLIHPVGVPFEPSRIAHAADLHHAFRSLYGPA